MKVTFVTALNNIRLTGNLARGDKLTEDLFITNERQCAESLLNPSFLESAGMLDTDSILNSNAIIYSVHEIPDDIDTQKYLIEYCRLCKAFLNCLWFVKDNSADFELAFLIYPKSGGYVTNRNFLSTVNTDCLGEKTVTSFDREELRKARKFFRESVGKIIIEGDYTGSVMKKSVPRMPRAFIFLGAARSVADLAMKIFFYCTTFETIFSTSTSEIAHQLAERISLFLCADFVTRKQTYHRVLLCGHCRCLRGGHSSSHLRRASGQDFGKEHNSD